MRQRLHAGEYYYQVWPCKGLLKDNLAIRIVSHPPAVEGACLASQMYFLPATPPKQAVKTLKKYINYKNS